jgi:hypothetical protein
MVLTQARLSQLRRHLDDRRRHRERQRQNLRYAARQCGRAVELVARLAAMLRKRTGPAQPTYICTARLAEWPVLRAQLDQGGEGAAWIAIRFPDRGEVEVFSTAKVCPDPQCTAHHLVCCKVAAAELLAWADCGGAQENLEVSDGWEAEAGN